MNRRSTKCEEVYDECRACHVLIKDFKESSCEDECIFLQEICRDCVEKCEEEIE